MSKLKEYAKGLVAAIVSAAIAYLSDADTLGVILSVIAGGGSVAVVPNKRKAHR